MKILLEDDSLIAVYKEAGLPSQTASLAGKDLVSEVKNYLAGIQGIKMPYLALINRLDQPVEGIVLFAKNEKSAAALSRQLQSGEMKKHYQALIYGHMPDDEGQLTDYMYKDAKGNCSKIVKPTQAGAKKAELRYQVAASTELQQLLNIELLTGRHHQIRLQLSSRNCPLIGDLKYGTPESVAYSKQQGIRQIGLCACSLSFLHPVNHKVTALEIESENPLIQKIIGGIV